VPQLEGVLGVTYGVIVYQEQVMQIASQLAGFTLGEADLLRRAMGKMKRDVMAAQRDKFVAGAKERKISEKDAKKIFELMEYFAGYGFNRSHSTAYALVAYHTAWLKVHHPRHFMAALLTAEKENTDNIVKYIGACRVMAIPVLPPDLNRSELDFTVEEEGLRFGLGAVKNVGETAVTTILEARRRLGRIGSVAGLCREVDGRVLNKRVVESLIKAGALDGLGPSRAALFAGVDRAMDSAQKAKSDRESGQGGLFGGGGAAQVDEEAFGATEEWPRAQVLAGEKETLGFYLSGHPLQDEAPRFRGLVSHTTTSLLDVQRPGPATLAGLVSALKKRRTKKGDAMAVFNLADLEGSVEVIVFPEAFARQRSLLEEDAALLVTGTVEVDEDRRRVIAETLLPLQQAEEKKAREVVLSLPDEGLEPGVAERLRTLLSDRPGPCPVFLEVTRPEGFRATLKAAGALKVSPSRDLTLALEDVLGKGSVRFR
jgi:DNA polymerase-3 subunit alpha